MVKRTRWSRPKNHVTQIEVLASIHRQQRGVQAWGAVFLLFFLKKYKLLFRFKDNLMGRVFRAQKVTQFQVA